MIMRGHKNHSIRCMDEVAHPIGKTAQFAAHCRVLESRRPDPLFFDPFAKAFAGFDSLLPCDLL